MKAGIQAIIRKINEDGQRHSSEHYSQVKDSIDQMIDNENELLHEESDKEREVLRKHNEHEYMRRLEYQRSRLNRELLIYQHELTDEVFDMAVVKLRDVSTNEFSKMLKKALEGLSGSFTMYIGALSKGKLDSSALKEAFEANPGLIIVLSPETIPQRSGFILRDDRVEYNHLFEDLVEDIKSEQTTKVLKEIFGNSPDWMFD